MRLWELGRSVEKDLEIRNLAMPFMRELRDCFDETINLGILEDEEIIYVGMVESKRSLRMRAELGGRDPAYSTSLGKAMLAFLPGERWREHVPSQLKPRTRRTHTSLQTLKEDLKMTRKRGFAVDHGENEEGARCVGAPVFDREGVVAAISLSAPESRLEDSHEQEVAAAVRRVAAKISERLAGATVGDDERHTNKSSRR